MYKLILILLTLLSFKFISCKQYKLIDGTYRYATIIADSSVFKDERPFTISYKGKTPWESNTIYLAPDKQEILFINKPTQVLSPVYFTNFIIYPRERISLSVNKAEDRDIVSITNRGKRRNREANSFTELKEYKFKNNKLYLTDSLDIYMGKHEDGVEEININEKKLRQFLPTYLSLHDSLNKIFLKEKKYSRKYKKFIKSSLSHPFEYPAAMQRFYNKHRDTLAKHNLFEQKHMQLSDYFNTKLTDKELSTYGFIASNNLSDALNIRLHNINDSIQVAEILNFIDKHYHHQIKNYLKAQTFFWANKRRVNISQKHWQDFYNDKDNYYAKSIERFILSKQNLIKEPSEKKDLLISVDGKTKNNFNEILEKHKGSVILLDFWATWCIPCIEQVPYIDTLTKELADKSFIIITVSLDSEISTWQKWVLRQDKDLKYQSNNYLLLNRNASFKQEHNITTIPRYILIGKDGNIINADAPRPSDPALKKLIEENL